MIRAILFLSGMTIFAAPPIALMPMPLKVSPGAGRMVIDSDFQIVLTNSDPQLRSAATRLRERIFRQTGLPLLPSGSGKTTLTVGADKGSAGLPGFGDDESYTLDVTVSGARLKAATVTGALRGMATFVQLIRLDNDGFAAPAVHIEDRPRFPWRGLMIDVSRHWMPVSVIERNLDAMAAVKMNVFHWHLSDDQGFRVESKRFPKLHELGSDGYYYTQDEVRHIIAYAAARGIRVVPEFDVPAHTTAWFVGYPELASGPGPYAIERKWGVFAPTIDPTRETTYEFLDAFLGEMTSLFPDEYFHIGGDEVVPKQWRENAQIQKFVTANGLKDMHGLQAYFNKRVQKLLAKYNKKMIGWDEILQKDLPKDIVIQSWRGEKGLAEATNAGFRGILSWGYYLDHLRPASYYYNNPAQSERAVGGEACMWNEYVSEENEDSRIWPSTAAIAERLWSPPDVKDVRDMYARLDVVSHELRYEGLRHLSYQHPMLDRLAGGVAPKALQVLADALESNLLDQRRKRHFTHRVPLNRMVDAVPPESEFIRRLQGATPAQLREVFTVWRDNHTVLLPVLRTNALLREVIPLSENLSKAGALGLQALDKPETKASLRTQMKGLETTYAELSPAFVLVLTDVLR